MKASELRIGNLINHRGYPKHVNKAILYKFDDMESDYFTPILLTEEWLLKFGFVEEGSEEGEDGALEFGDFDGDDLYMIYFPKTGRYVDETGFSFIKEGIGRLDLYLEDIKYVHQLQNLYFTLAGKELTIK